MAYQCQTIAMSFETCDEINERILVTSVEGRSEDDTILNESIDSTSSSSSSSNSSNSSSSTRNSDDDYSTYSDDDSDYSDDDLTIVTDLEIQEEEMDTSEDFSFIYDEYEPLFVYTGIEANDASTNEFVNWTQGLLMPVFYFELSRSGQNQLSHFCNLQKQIQQ